MITYQDSETGQLMVAESVGGRGARVTEFNEYMDMAERRGYELYAADGMVASGQQQSFSPALS